MNIFDFRICSSDILFISLTSFILETSRTFYFFCEDHSSKRKEFYTILSFMRYFPLTVKNPNVESDKARNGVFGE